MKRYIYEHSHWPQLQWDHSAITSPLAQVRNRQGLLLGKMQSLGFPLQKNALLETLTLDVVKSSEIEGALLPNNTVRSSIARKLGLDIAGLVPSDRHVDGVVEMILDATQNFSSSLTKERLCGWQASLFPTGFSGIHKIRTGTWRNDDSGPMRVVSGRMGREIIHFEAPAASAIEKEMHQFLRWANQEQMTDGVLIAAIAHLWFITIHPFEDGNGRVARAITDMFLARSDQSAQRFYSMSAAIRKERDAYYSILEKSQKIQASHKALDITAWLLWFLQCLDRALNATGTLLSSVFDIAAFWENHLETGINIRQREMLNRLLHGFEGKLTSSKWAKIMKCSQDTALRDIEELLVKKILVKDHAGGRSTSYSLKK